KWHILLFRYSAQLLYQQFLFSFVPRHCRSAFDFFTSFSKSAQFHQQIAANTGKQVVIREGRLPDESVQRSEPGGWALGEPHGYRTIQCHNRGRADLEQSVVEKDDPLPVGLFG